MTKNWKQDGYILLNACRICQEAKDRIAGKSKSSEAPLELLYGMTERPLDVANTSTRCHYLTSESMGPRKMLHQQKDFSHRRLMNSQPVLQRLQGTEP